MLGREPSRLLDCLGLFATSTVGLDALRVFVVGGWRFVAFLGLPLGARAGFKTGDSRKAEGDGMAIVAM